MAALSEFAGDLFEEAKRFLENSADSDAGKSAFLHASLLLGFASFEAHVNAISDDFLSRDDLSPFERGLLSEKSVELVDGEFTVKETLKMQRLEDRMLFLCKRFSTTPLDRKAPYWGEFVEASRLRNRLTHPKGNDLNVDEDEVKRALTAILSLLNTLCLALYQKPLPAFRRGLASKATF